ncbi:MAG TPA: transglutaminase domain-containing protein, partial [Candidatus Thermoplasmatota archaeon]|nr:transglutaminase domain-containing protein [Candidatus Thermoplasmatota archaeon]
MRARFWIAWGALAAALALLVPTFGPLSSSMDSFADELANGTFRPFGSTGGGSSARPFTGSLGGLTGSSQGNFLPGSVDLPQRWFMDRDGRGGAVVIDSVFNPDLGAMKRLKAFDRVGEDGETLEVASRALTLLRAEPGVRYDSRIAGSFDVQLAKGRPVPIYSVHPKGAIESYATTPPVGSITFLRDSADTVYALADHDGVVTLNLTYRTARDYYVFDPPDGVRVGDYPPSMRPVVPASLREDAQVVLARAGVPEGADVATLLRALNVYFRSFTEGPIPDEDQVDSLYLALALGGHGCCRHRAFAYMVTAQAAGVPARVVVNEAHAFVEVQMPDGLWHQVNLGGCGSYTLNNPNGYPSYLDSSSDPRGEANPDEGRPVPLVPSFTNITESPSRIVKGERYFVNGTVLGADGQGVPGARVDVYLNATKDSPGRLTGAGTTDSQGRFVVEARVPKDVGARGYQLVARASDGARGSVRFAESWSDPEVDVFAPTRFAFAPQRAAAGIPANVSGRLLDVDGNAVSGAAVRWGFADPDQGVVRTDARGGFTLRVNFTALGNNTVVFSYDGDDHHGAAAATAVVRVDRGAILLPGEAARVDRGQAGALSGQVAVAGVRLEGVEVIVHVSSETNGTIVASGTGVADRDGRFAIPVRVPVGAPTGTYAASYEAPSVSLSATTLVVVTARPVLRLDAPDAVPSGEGFQATATLVSDDGTPIAGAPVALRVDGGEPLRTVPTDNGGVARFDVPSGALPRGDHALRATFDGDPTHSEAQASRTLRLALPWYARVPWQAYAAAGGLALAAA